MERSLGKVNAEKDVQMEIPSEERDSLAVKKSAFPSRRAPRSEGISKRKV